MIEIFLKMLCISGIIHFFITISIVRQCFSHFCEYNKYSNVNVIIIMVVW